MDLPGANSDSQDALLLNEATLSLESPVAPTLIALEIQPGLEIPVDAPSLPAAITVAMPAERRLSMAALIEALFRSHSLEVV